MSFQDFGVIPAVFVLESPSTQDVVDGRREGHALCGSLELAGIPNVYFDVSDRASLNAAIDDVVARARQMEEDRAQLQKGDPLDNPLCPHLHFSAHGSEDGIGLTNGDFVKWEEVRAQVLAVGTKLGLIGFKKIAPTGLVSVAFSACRGAHAKAILVGSPLPCPGVVGPNCDVLWSDSLTAFTTFYHLVLVKDLQIADAIPTMNAAAGLEGVFELHVARYPGASTASK